MGTTHHWKLALLAVSSVLTASCTSSNPPNLAVGSAADVKTAHVAIDSHNSRNASDYEWLLNQVGLRCVQEQGGSVPKTVFKRPPSPKPNENTKTNSWLGHTPLALTKGVQKS